MGLDMSYRLGSELKAEFCVWKRWSDLIRTGSLSGSRFLQQHSLSICWLLGKTNVCWWDVPELQVAKAMCACCKVAFNSLSAVTSLLC